MEPVVSNTARNTDQMKTFEKVNKQDMGFNQEGSTFITNPNASTNFDS